MFEIFESAGIKVSETNLRLFDNYYKLLIKYNAEFNITAITEEKEVYIKHFADSLKGAEYMDGGTLADVGSGGGFPGIPLKILKSDLKVTLIEATEKKCEFLRTVIKELNLSDINVICGRAEELGHGSLRESFDYATARAVGRLNSLCEYTLPLIKVGGKFVCYKADAEEEIKEAENSIKILGGKVLKKETFDLFGSKRTIVVIEKGKPTPKEFPRRNAKILKKPL